MQTAREIQAGISQDVLMFCTFRAMNVYERKDV
jgi:hypothetical protein